MFKFIDNILPRILGCTTLAWEAGSLYDKNEDSDSRDDVVTPFRNQFANFRKKIMTPTASQLHDDVNTVGEARPRLICGLGNPGTKYVGTRHNIGVSCLDELAVAYGLASDRKKSSESAFREIEINGTKILLAYPTSFYNETGIGLGKKIRKQGIKPSEIVVICDDIDLRAGEVRMRLTGGNGGNRGLKSIINVLGTQHIPRIRVGVGRPVGENSKPVYESDEIANWVLSRPHASDLKQLSFVTAQIVSAVKISIADSNESAMNFLNSGT
ncbi:MAG: aminoacyl-tRNA hydrolase [Dehalococcoidia bacterium]|nr:aminoacyl-tRNA hydrolase [Dehalococcoidia bacterium]